MFTQHSQRTLHTESKYSIAASIGFSQISPENKMIELGAIMSPFLQVKESKYYLDEVQAKLSQHTLFYLRYKGLQKKYSQLQLVKFATY